MNFFDIDVVPITKEQLKASKNEIVTKKEEDPNAILHIAIFGDMIYENSRKIKETLFELKKSLKSREFIVYSLGSLDGADKYIKKFCLELNIKYLEFTPLYMPETLYSVNKQFITTNPKIKFSNKHIKDITRKCSRFMIFIKNNEVSEKFKLKKIIELIDKSNKKYILINDI